MLFIAVTYCCKFNVFVFVVVVTAVFVDVIIAIIVFVLVLIIVVANIDAACCRYRRLKKLYISL